MIDRNIRVLIILIFLVTLHPALYPSLAIAADAEPTWTSLAPMPTARGGFGLAVVDGRIYAIGGLNDDGLVGATEEYNPQTNEWTSKMPMPTPRRGFAIAVVQNKIYVIGGTVGNGYVGNNEVYDPINNNWETKTSMPTPRADLCANVVDDKIYLIGGKRYSNITPFHKETNINEVYNPSNDTWSTKTPIPTPVQGYASAVINNKIYVVGGSIESLSMETTIITGANQVYDPRTDLWSKAAQLPMVNSYGAAATTEGYMAPEKAYVVGGFIGGEFSGQTQAYNAKNNSWTNVDPMPTSRAYLGVAIVRDILYAMGGFDGRNWLDANEQFKPVGYGTVAPIVQLISPENKTYSEASITFSVNRGTVWTGYSLDQKENLTIASETKLSRLSEGSHSVRLYTNDSLGNMGSSNLIFFSIDTLPPIIQFINPQNQSYDATDIQLTFTVNEGVKYLAYSLDGQENIEIIGNVTLPALSNGSHQLTLYATDDLGNSAQKIVAFNIALFPTIAVAAIFALVIIAVTAGYLLIKLKKTSATKNDKFPTKQIE